MESKTPHRFDPQLVPGLSTKAQAAVKAVFDAMSTWRSEAADDNERHCKEVVDKMAAAAATLGWPEQIVDAARTQMQSITDIQNKTMDNMMDAWEEQLKLPSPTDASPSAMLSKLKSMPGSAPLGGWPNADAFPMSAMNPFQFWTQVAEQWQKSWADTITTWANAGKSNDIGGLRRH